MTFTLDAEVAAVLQAALEKNGPPPSWPAGDVQARRVALDAMLEYFNNQAQPPAHDVEVTDHQVTAADGAALLARWYRLPSSPPSDTFEKPIRGLNFRLHQVLSRVVGQAESQLTEDL